MSEAAIQLLHGNTQVGDAQVFMDIRTATSRTVRLQFNSKCPLHPTRRHIDFRLHLPPQTTCGGLLEELESRMARPVVRLTLSFLVRVGCAQCKQPISVRQSDWIMASLLFCTECGGEWPRIDKPGNEIYTTLSADTEPLLGLSVEQVGLVPGTVVEAKSDDAEVTFELEAASELPFFIEAQENRNVVQIVS